MGVPGQSAGICHLPAILPRGRLGLRDPPGGRHHGYPHLRDPALAGDVGQASHLEIQTLTALVRVPLRILLVCVHGSFSSCCCILQDFMPLEPSSPQSQNPNPKPFS